MAKKPSKSAKPARKKSNGNDSRLTKLGINFSLNDEEQTLFAAVRDQLLIPEGAKKEVFIKSLEYVYKSETEKSE